MAQKEPRWNVLVRVLCCIVDRLGRYSILRDESPAPFSVFLRLFRLLLQAVNAIPRRALRKRAKFPSLMPSNPCRSYTLRRIVCNALCSCSGVSFPCFSLCAVLIRSKRSLSASGNSSSSRLIARSCSTSSACVMRSSLLSPGRDLKIGFLQLRCFWCRSRALSPLLFHKYGKLSTFSHVSASVGAFRF